MRALGSRCSSVAVAALLTTLVLLCVSPVASAATAARHSVGTRSVSTLNDLYAVAASGAAPGMGAVAVGAGGTILQTTDGGFSWQWRAALDPRFDLLDIDFAPGGLTGFAVGRHGMLITTTDGGTTWDGLVSDTTLDLRSVSVVSSSLVWICGGGPSRGDPTTNEGIVLRSHDGGVSWELRNLSDPAWTTPALGEFQYDAVSGVGTRVWLGGQHPTTGITVLSTDSGSTWRAAALPSPLTQPFTQLKMTATGSGYGIAGGALYHTGDDWQSAPTAQATPAAPLARLDLSPVTAGLGWAVGGAGTILNTTDGGTWLPQASGVAGDLTGVSAATDSIVWAVGKGGTLLRTTDGGASWGSMTGPTDVTRPACYATARARGAYGKTVTLRYKVTDVDSPLVNVVIKVKTRAGRVVKTSGKLLKPVKANYPLTWKFTCKLAKGSYLYYVYANDLCGNAQKRIGKNVLTVT